MQVALGRCKDVYQRELVTGAPDGYDSIRAVAASYPDPQYDLTLPTGFITSLPLLSVDYSTLSGSYDISREA